MEIAFSLGSNLGDRLALMQQARDALATRAVTGSSVQSSVYETEPVGVKPEYAGLRFLNAVVVVETGESAEAWLQALAGIEQRLGRVRTEDRYAPRTIDIDILYAGDHCIGSGGLTVPHPRWAERRFVVEPLAEVRPHLVLPGEKRTVLEILDGLPKAESLQRLATAW